MQTASAVTCQAEEDWFVVEELTRQFPNVWCPVCEQVHPILLVENAANNHAAAVDLHANRHGTGEDPGR